jgi:tetratricopeptide (TPR) repeat protein
VLTGDRRFDIDVISAIPRDWKKWGGFSGTAIFADNVLVGVVRTVDENWNGGVLEATPAVWLLEDIGFKKILECAGLSLPVRLDVGAADRIMPLDLGADASIEGTLRFSPRNPLVPFRGREAALGALNEFLVAERNRPFTWWLVTGSGGAGKTRLACELCLRLRQRGWRAGFLPDSFVADIADLDAWCPRTPTLIVADYVMKRIDEIRKLAARLARRDGLPPLRLLLLEREPGKLFESQFLGSDTSNRGVIEQARYQPDPLSLSELTEDEIWSLVEACPWRSDATRVPLARNEFFQRLDQLDSQRRPLVAMILADTLATSGAGAGLGGLKTVLRDLVTRERDHLWPEELGVANTAIGKTEADIAIAFATMVDGLGPPELEAIRMARGKPIDPGILPACGSAIGKPLGSVPLLGRLEPDLIGEFFALETLSGDPNNSFAVSPHSWMPKAAWRMRGSAMADFVRRAKQTFPEHAAIEQVNITVEGVEESWLLAAETILSGANDLWVALDDVLKWIRPRAHSDVGAARALVQLSRQAIAVGARAPVLMTMSDAFRELLQAHLDEAALRESAADALIRIGCRLDDLGRRKEAISVYDDVVARLGAASELPLREQVAKALFNKGVTLGHLGRSEKAISVYDDLLVRFGAATEPMLLEQVAYALVNKGAMLRDIGHRRRAIAVCDDVVARFGAATEPALREQVAYALVNKVGTFGDLGRSKKAIAVCDDLLARFGTASELSLVKCVADALAYRGVMLRDLGRRKEAIAVFDDVVARFGMADEEPLREPVARALVDEGVTLDELGRSEEAIAVYDDVDARFGFYSYIRKMLARALAGEESLPDDFGRPGSDLIDRVRAYKELRADDIRRLSLEELLTRAADHGFTLGNIADHMMAPDLSVYRQVQRARDNKKAILRDIARSKGDRRLRRCARAIRRRFARYRYVCRLVLTAVGFIVGIFIGGHWGYFIPTPVQLLLIIVSLLLLAASLSQGIKVWRHK